MQHSGVVMHQTKYARDLLKKYNMQHSNTATTPVKSGLKLESNSEEEGVDLVMYISMVGSLR